MSDAKKCDQCGSIFEIEKGCIQLDVSIAIGNEKGEWDMWTGVDFCPACSPGIRQAIGKVITE